MGIIKFSKLSGLLFWLPLVVFFFACEKKDNDDIIDNPASFELVEVDYITSNTATFTADIFGDMEEVNSIGFCWATNNQPTVDDFSFSTEPEPGLYSYEAGNLLQGTDWFMRAFYTSNNEVYYSAAQQFRLTDSITDFEGNVYEVIQIGDQLWMGENLKTKHYNNGNLISSGTGMGNYSGLTEPAFWFWYDDLQSNIDTLGLLYTWFVITDSRGICPQGYRVPDIMDWENLVIHLDALATPVGDLDAGNRELSALAGGMLKATGNREDGSGIWEAPNGGATNITKMSVLPSGVRDPTGSFDGKWFNAAFWSYTEETTNNAIMFYVHFFNSGIYSNQFNKKSGYAVRCMKEAGQ